MDREEVPCRKIGNGETGETTTKYYASLDVANVCGRMDANNIIFLSQMNYGLGAGKNLQTTESHICQRKEVPCSRPELWCIGETTKKSHMRPGFSVLGSPPHDGTF